MKLSLFMLGIFAVMICIARPAEANWCAHYNMGGGATNCGFKTHHECLLPCAELADHAGQVLMAIIVTVIEPVTTKLTATDRTCLSFRLTRKAFRT
jgi:hypothetical protein